MVDNASFWNDGSGNFVESNPQTLTGNSDDNRGEETQPFLWITGCILYQTAK